MIIPNSDDQIARQVAERIRKGVEAMSVTCDDEEVKVTISVGVSQLAPGEPSKTFLGRADKAMYQAKELGRNQVVMAK